MVFETLTGKQILVIAVVAITLMIVFALIFSQQISDFVSGAILIFFLTVLGGLVMIMWWLSTQLPDKIKGWN